MPGLRLLSLVVACAPTLATAQTPVTSPNPHTQGFGGQFGAAVASLGELDDDGTRDVLVGAPGEMVGLAEGAGRAYAISGATLGPLLTLVSPNPEQGGDFGRSIKSAGDLTGDDVPDIIVGAPFEDAGGVSGAGRAYVFSGADGSLLFTLESPFPTVTGLFGLPVARLGDVDGDAINDLGIGALSDDPFDPASGSRPGAAYVFSGADGSLLHVARGIADGDRFGAALAGTDLDGDDLADFIVGVPNGPAPSGESSGLVIAERSATTTPLTYVPPFPSDAQMFGVTLDTVGDRDGDGVAEVLIGATDSAYVFSGATGNLLSSLGSPEGPGGRFGFAVAGAGNVDETGAADLIIGAAEEDAHGMSGAGRIYIFSGDDGALIRSITSPNAEPNGRFGHAVALAGAIDEDNTADQIVGAPGEAGGAGRAYLLLSASVVTNEPSPGEPSLTLTASPNPARGTLRLHVLSEAEGAAPGGGTLTVLDALGREVYRGEIRGTASLDVSGWAPGVYLARLTTSEGVVSRAVTVTR